jgi:hypothetical protein
MCKNAAPLISNLLAKIRPTVVSVETILGVVSTPDGIASLAAYDAIIAAFATYVPGTSAQVIVELIGDFAAGFNAIVAAIPVVPPEVADMIDTILAGLALAIGLLEGNATADPEKQKEIMSKWDAARADLGDHMVIANEYKKSWNQDIAAAIKIDPKYAAYKLS